jgi:hypothetical protein
MHCIVCLQILLRQIHCFLDTSNLLQAREYTGIW